ncbi:IS5 family transposase [Methylobacterium sp. 1030]|uniref:IS5 family transposase n=1 Tax=Methylobacterium sp. 1030 TaxID=3156404 RepID=UPI003390FFD2
MARLFWLSDETWGRIEPHLPHGQPGKPRVDDRRVISGILHVLKVGCRWQDTPSAYGPHTTVYNRYNRWSQHGIWQRLFAKIAAAGPVPDELMLDASHVKAHRSASGGKGGPGPRRSATRGAGSRVKSIAWPMIVADRSRSP